MMRRLSAIVILVAVFLLMPVRADAMRWDDWWDYLDHLTGPGPFHGGPSIAATIVCRDNDRLEWKHAVVNPGPLDWCLYGEWRRLEAERKAPFGEVTANLIEVGISLQPYKFVEVGAGAGFAQFTSPLDNREDPLKKVSFTVTPIRIAVKPLRLVPRWRDDTRLGFLQIVFRSTVRVGHLTAADFGVPGSTWESDSEVISKFFRFTVAIDVLQALRRPPTQP